MSGRNVMQCNIVWRGGGVLPVVYSIWYVVCSCRTVVLYSTVAAHGTEQSR